MKKLMIYTLLSILVIIVAVVLLSLTNPHRKSNEEIRDSILELTPISTSMEDVLKVVESNKKWKTEYVSYEHGISQGDLGRAGTSIGEKSIRVLIGKYRNPVVVYVSVFWAFDENFKLIDVYVIRTGGF
jgi:ABC-type dipeptide/oligopeptide/nickel transport system permease component